MTTTSFQIGPEERRGMLLQLSPETFSALTPLVSEVRTVRSHRALISAWQPVDESLLLLNGFMMRHVSDRQGQRQMVGIQVAGDFVDLHGLPLGRLDHDLSTIGEVRLAVFPHAALRDAIRRDGDLAEALWRLTMIDAAMHRHWSFRLGRLRARAGMANFLSEIDARLRLSGRGTDDRFDLPLTQTDLAGVCGLSPVHVNRVLRELREAGLCDFRDGTVILHDRQGLNEAGEFDGRYLYAE